MGLEPKATPVMGDLYVAQIDGSLVKEKAKEQEQPVVRLINALSNALTTITTSVLSSIDISKYSNENDNKGLEPKSTPMLQIESVAPARRSSIDGSPVKEQEQPPAVNPFKDDSRIQALRLVNALAYALTTASVLSSIHISIRDEYDNYAVWMTNQTLLSVAPYTQYIWYMLFFLQGLFIVASFLPSLWSSELLGYTALATITGKEAIKEAIKKPSPVMLYLALCASTVLMVYSFNMNMTSLAFVGSCACTYLLVTIMRFQVDTVTGLSNETGFSKIKRWFQGRRASASTLQSAPDENTLNNFLNDVDVTNQIQQYIFIKLPFELYAGYNLALNVTLLNVIVHKSIGSAALNVVLAYVSLVLLLVVGCYVMWKEKKGLCYGVGAGLAWYLVSCDIT
jgi:hypothetical protein